MNKQNPQKKFVYSGHQGSVYALEQGPLQHLFYSGSGDHLVVEWNQLTHEPGTVILSIPHIIYSLKYHPDKKLLLAGTSHGGIHIVDLELKKEIKLLAFHQGPVFDLVLSKEHNLLLSAGGDGYLHAISMDNFNLVKSIHFGNLKIRSVVISPDGYTAVVGCQDGSVAIISLPELSVEYRFEAHKSGFSVNTSLFIADGTLLLTGSRDACIHVFDVKNKYVRVDSIPAHNYAVYHLVANPDQTCFASASRDKAVKVWNTENMKILARLDLQHYGGHVNSVNRLLWTTGDALISCGDDRSIIEWEVK